MKLSLSVALMLSALFACRNIRSGAGKVAPDAACIAGFNSVFRLSPATAAIVLINNDTSSAYGIAYAEACVKDSLLYYPAEQLAPNCTYFDTTGPYKLFINSTLENKLLPQLPPFYIYGTKGAARCKVGHVVLGFDECRTNILAFTITGFDTTRYGQPLYASEKPLRIAIGTNYSAIEKKIARLEALEQLDYKDLMTTTVFAHSDSCYFAYRDNFMWGNVRSDTSCFLPGRSVYQLQSTGTLKRIWAEELDLLGIPCD